jgi:hypothetical protein
MTALAWVLVGSIGTFVLAAVGDLVSEEIRGWLDLAPVIAGSLDQLDPLAAARRSHWSLASLPASAW